MTKEKFFKNFIFYLSPFIILKINISSTFAHCAGDNDKIINQVLSSNSSLSNSGIGREITRHLNVLTDFSNFYSSANFNIFNIWNHNRFDTIDEFIEFITRNIPQIGGVNSQVANSISWLLNYSHFWKFSRSFENIFKSNSSLTF